MSAMTASIFSPSLRERRAMPRILGGLVLLSSVALSSCDSEFATPHSSSLLSLTLTHGSPGAPTALLPLQFVTPDTFTFDLKAMTPDGQVDATFNGYVRLSAHPGSISSVVGNGAEGRNVQLTNGVATGIQVEVLAAYGNTHIWAEDIGYTPADPLGATPPQCSDGIDNNDNSLIDFPADPGCAYANDNSEDEGSYTTGISQIIYYASPRVADVRGVGEGGSVTSFPNEQVDMDVGYRTTVPCQDGTAPPCYDFSVVVTRISSTGFYVTDINDPRGFSSVYAYNFSAPPNMSVCDRLTSFGGTASDFFGYTEVNYPTWSLDEWRGPTARPCLVPDPVVFNYSDLPFDFDMTPTLATASTQLLGTEASLVRVAASSTSVKGTMTTDGVSAALHIGAKFGAGKPVTPSFLPTTDATDCDLNGDGKVDFTAGTDEGTCSAACDSDSECTEYSNYISENQFRLVLVQTNTDGSVHTGTIFADASAAASFDPLVERGKQLTGFTGTLGYFSGGTQFTIQARCPDDIVLTGDPLNSDTACVSVRTASEFSE